MRGGEKHTRQDDMKDLRLLHLRECEGGSLTDCMEASGRSKGSVIGFQNRIRNEHAKCECHCTKPENKDGGMPDRGWAK